MAVIDVAKSARLQSRSSLGLARAKLAQALLDFPIAFAFRVVEPLLPFCGLHQVEHGRVMSIGGIGTFRILLAHQRRGKVVGDGHTGVWIVMEIDH